MKREFAWAIALIGIASQLSLRAAVTEELHKTYPLDPDGRVSLHNVHGAVHISAWDRNDVQVDAIKTASSKEILDEANIVIDAASGSISIRTRYPEWHTMRNPATVEYTLKVPRRARLSAIECVHGSLEITGVSGEVKASSVHGSVTARNLSAEARLSTVHGNLDASFDRIDGTPSISLTTVHGNIDLTIPDGAALEYSASTTHGRIESGRGTIASGHHKMGGSISGRTGAGGAHIKLSTVHGNIRIASTIGGRRVLYV